jgi:hypothetical protein
MCETKSQKDITDSAKCTHQAARRRSRKNRPIRRHLSVCVCVCVCVSGAGERIKLLTTQARLTKIRIHVGIDAGTIYFPEVDGVRGACRGHVTRCCRNSRERHK